MSKRKNFPKLFRKRRKCAQQRSGGENMRKMRKFRENERKLWKLFIIFLRSRSRIFIFFLTCNFSLLKTFRTSPLCQRNFPNNPNSENKSKSSDKKIFFRTSQIVCQLILALVGARKCISCVLLALFPSIRKVSKKGKKCIFTPIINFKRKSVRKIKKLDY